MAQSGHYAHRPECPLFGGKADITSPRGSGPQAGCLNYRHEGAPQFPSHLGGNAQPQTGGGSPVPVEP
jgi:hypothetical protein